MKTAVGKWGSALQYASQELQNNFDIVKIAVSNNCYALQFASSELQQNTELIALANKKKN